MLDERIARFAPRKSKTISYRETGDGVRRCASRARASHGAPRSGGRLRPDAARRTRTTAARAARAARGARPGGHGAEALADARRRRLTPHRARARALEPAAHPTGGL